MPKKLTKEEFIKRSRAIHGDKYDYSLVEYRGKDIKVKIICPIHGVFEQTPNNHMHGAGCYKCGRDTVSKKTRYTKEDFIRVATEKHNNKYDYSLVDYVNSQGKIKIICPVHGVFEQKANNHMNGLGCRLCANEENAKRQTKSAEEFIKKAREVHGDKYDYSKVVYENWNKRVCIICPTHGEFWQTPGNHLHGWGCKKCSQSHLESEMLKALNEAGISFEYQKTFEWLKYKSKLSLDFYLPDYNIAIECQGVQHYFPTSFGGEISPEEFFSVVSNRDTIKKNLCEKHGVKILYYTHENIEKSSDTFFDIATLIDGVKNINRSL